MSRSAGVIVAALGRGAQVYAVATMLLKVFKKKYRPTVQPHKKNGTLGKQANTVN